MPEVLGGRISFQASYVTKNFNFLSKVQRIHTKIHHYFKSGLGDAFTEPAGSPDLSFFRLVDMFLGATAEGVKADILPSFRDAAGHLCVLICTSAFGMGIDCKCVS